MPSNCGRQPTGACPVCATAPTAGASAPRSEARLQTRSLATVAEQRVELVEWVTWVLRRRDLQTRSPRRAKGEGDDQSAVLAAYSSKRRVKLDAAAGR